jgi:hypothetical protein
VLEDFNGDYAPTTTAQTPPKPPETKLLICAETVSDYMFVGKLRLHTAKGGKYTMLCVPRCCRYRDADYG